MNIDIGRIRNFSIIAHVDHGKSTLADRLIEATHTVEKRNMKSQVLDTLELERERGITIKLVPVRMNYTAKDGGTYILNLIDTPGHVDFNYEVSRSLAACEGAILVVDAAQGVEAQTVANAYLAVEQNLDLIPVFNKIDLPSASPERIAKEIEEVIGLDASKAVPASAKDGTGVDEILERIVADIRPPSGDRNAPLSALIFDSVYDNYKGVISYVRVVDGYISARKKISFMATGEVFEVEETGVFTPAMRQVDSLGPGEVGYIVAGIKSLSDANVGDTITDARNPVSVPLPGYKKMKPVVFCGYYPIEREEINALREALEKLQINDSAITFEPESSSALGFGFRCGFLGLLHMEIAKERLFREFGVELLATPPNVAYRIKLTDGSVIESSRPSDFPADASKQEEILEPFIRVALFMPDEYVGPCIQLCQERRGVYASMDYIAPGRVRLVYDLPLAEFILDFHDRLKSVTRGYASLDYEHAGYRPSDLVKIDILIRDEPVDAFSFICHRDAAYNRGHAAATKLKELI
ncbi:MAG: translation elongation factor 4, partial [Synergistaceae bacterium]|nr:translation elongation factor 4 [Synergistaceae bacterium]